MTPKVAVIDYGIGNLRSAQKALEAVGVKAELCSDPEALGAFDALVLPGVGSFGRCVEELDRHGLREALSASIAGGKPFLGVCIGLQLLFEGSEESPDAKGLAMLQGDVERIKVDLALPQMQWNQVQASASGHLAKLVDQQWFYFVHSYVAPQGEFVAAHCNYGMKLPAAIERENLWAVQFHPEKSGQSGLAFLGAFVEHAMSL